ncbi:BamA/TamA family outer membrane protein [Moritella sp. 24]|uniref:BamA/TamA family outer membrane protein n=1 Tax=Moritella sp. 24 TaxID=2746230 RepID=UPI002104F2B4|nr:BamA/TamA family outer membrane protein [Moritella sp. 24]
MLLIPAILMVSSLLSTADAGTNTKENETSWLDGLLENLGADGEYNQDKIIDFSVLPGPFYNPEMSFGIGVSAIGLYQVDKDDEVSQLSSLIINGFTSANGALGVAVENKTFLQQDSLRLYVDAVIADAPDVYYGTGYHDNRQDGNKVTFDSYQLSLTPSLRKRISEQSFIGVGMDFNYTATDDIDSGESVVDSSILIESSRSIGINLLVNYDSRDSVLSPSSGRLVELDSTWYRQEFGSETDFNVQSLLYSEYLSIGDSGDVFAWQVHGRFTQGDVPWDQLSMLGGGGLLRGYNSGRYRDEQMLLAQMEYRLNLTGRHGMVFWAGAGALADEFAHLSTDELLPTAGVGYRFQVKPKVNLRLDMGFGNGDSGFYFNVNEAF